LSAEPRRLVILVGPTAAGKSRAAARLALARNGEVVNCDSQQVYRGFDIGTDKPSAETRAAVPHHLIDVADPRVQFTAADFAAGAMEAIREIHGRGRLPIVAGGSGLYVRALTDGLFPGPGRDAELRRALEAEAAAKGYPALFEELRRVDPAYAAKIHERDRVRIIRALEVYRATGRTLSEHFLATASPLAGLAVAKLGLTLARPELHRRIDARVDAMFARGLVEEVRGLLASGLPPTAPPFRGLGYRQVLAHLAGDLTFAEAVSAAKLETRQFAKRQMTWFRKMEGFIWQAADDLAELEIRLAAALQ
jgi:tRNA dimethylallyltransferase